MTPRKYTSHVPVEQYGYIGVELEGTPDEAVEAYREIQALIKVQPKGLSDNDFRKLYDDVAAGSPVVGDPGMLEQLNPYQRFALNEAKKFVKRTNR